MSEEKIDPENTSIPTEETPPSNIEKYNAKVKAEKEAEKVPDKVHELQKGLYDTLTAVASNDAKGYAKVFWDKGDYDSAILILQENVKNRKPAPNSPSIPQPVGTPKIGIAKYMKYVPGSDKISWSIPMSVLLDPEKNKKLGEY